MRKARSTFISSLVSTSWAVILLGISLLAGYEVLKLVEIESLPGISYLPDFLLTPLTTQTEHNIIITLAAVITGFSVLFIFGYVAKAVIDAIRLAIVTSSLRRFRSAGKMESPNSGITEWHWHVYPLFSRLWKEFAETLHRQPNPDVKDGGGSVLYRATMPAEVIFNIQTLVDIPLRVEFFRHLPGILTGAGIVSTFAGILVGLTEFNPVVVAELVTQELKNLFVGVSTAFVASFFAIFTAIFITVIEKLILQWRYSQVVRLQGFLDDCFKAGAEPEYLAKLVENGDAGLERIEAGLTKLADSLNLDDKEDQNTENLEALVFSLGETLAVDRKETVEALDLAIREGFSGPLKVISKAVELTLKEQSRRQEEIRNLENRLAGFGERMDVALRELTRGMAGFNEVILRLDETHGASLEKISTTISDSTKKQTEPSVDLRYFQTIAEELKELRNDKKQDSELNNKHSEELVVDFSNKLQETLASLSKQLPSQEGMNQLVDLLKQGSNAGISEARESAQSIVNAIENSGDKQENTLLDAMNSLEAATAARLEDSTNKVTSSITDIINTAVDSEVKEIKEAVADAANGIKSANEDSPSAEEIIVAIGSASSRQEDIMTDILKALEANIAATRKPEDDAKIIKEAISETTQTILANNNAPTTQEVFGAISSANSRQERIMSDILKALENNNAAIPKPEEEARAIKEAISEAAQDILAKNESPTTEEIIGAISSANSRQESILNDILKSLESNIAATPEFSPRELTESIENSINSAVAESSEGLKEAVTDAAVNILKDKDDSPPVEHLITAIGNANLRQEAIMANILNELKDNNNKQIDTLTKEAPSETPQEAFPIQDIITAIGNAKSSQEAIMANILEMLQTKTNDTPIPTALEITDSIKESIKSAVVESSQDIKEEVTKAAIDILSTNEDGPTTQEIISAIDKTNSNQEFLMDNMLKALEARLADNEDQTAQGILAAIGSANSNQEAIIAEMLQALEEKNSSEPNLSTQDIADSISETITNSITNTITDSITNSVDSAMAESSQSIKDAVSQVAMDVLSLSEQPPSTDELISAIQNTASNQENIMTQILKTLDSKSVEVPQVSAEEISNSIAMSIDDAMDNNSDSIKKSVKKAIKESFSDTELPTQQEIISAIQEATFQQEAGISKILQELTKQTSDDIQKSAQEITESITEQISSTLFENSEDIKKAVKNAALENKVDDDSLNNQEVITAIDEAALRQQQAINDSIEELAAKTSAGIQESTEEVKSSIAANLKESCQDVAQNMQTGFENSAQEITNSLKEGITESAQGVVNSINEGITESAQGVVNSINEGIIESAQEVTNSIKEGITESAQEVTNSVKESITESAKEVTNSIKENIAESAEDVTTTLDETINSVVSEGYDGIKAAVYEGSNGITDAVSAGFNGIKGAVSEGYQEVKDTVSENSDEVKNAVVEGLEDVKEVVAQEAEGVQQVVAASSLGIKEAVADSTKEVIAATGGDTFKEILTNMKLSAERLEKNLAKAFRDMEANSNNRIKSSSREIVSNLTRKVEGATKEILVATTEPPAPDALPSREFLTDFKDHLNKLIVSLANRINQVGGRIAKERQSLEENLKMLEMSIHTITETQGTQSKEHIDTAVYTSQEKLESGINKLGGNIQEELNQLQSLIKKTSGEISTRISTNPAKDTKTAEIDKQEHESIKRLETEFKNTMEQLGRRQDEVEKQRTEKLIGEVKASNNEVADRLQNTIRDEIVGTKQAISQNIQEAREEQSNESAELSNRISIISTISDKMANSVADITSGLNQLREKATEEKEELNTTMKGWVDDLANNTKQESKEIATQIKGVIEKVDDRHNGMISAIDELNQGMGDDLQDMKEKILNSGKESEQNISNTLNQVGKGVVESVNKSGEEQGAYIDLLTERLESMRKRLRVK
ncbi:MAG: hypothetical protein HQL71_09065 [Magnetococcales bacterium]|nr:hypothetical protein [Magnetococcales bacterium]